MSRKRVIWSEGLFLRPQHFQQSDRYFEKLIRSRVASLCPYPWGITELRLNRDMLSLGTISVRVQPNEHGKGAGQEEIVDWHDNLTVARAIYRGRVSQYPGRLVRLRDRARVLARSDRPETMP